MTHDSDNCTNCNKSIGKLDCIFVARATTWTVNKSVGRRFSNHAKTLQTLGTASLLRQENVLDMSIHQKYLL